VARNWVCPEPCCKSYRSFIWTFATSTKKKLQSDYRNSCCARPLVLPYHLVRLLLDLCSVVLLHPAEIRDEYSVADLRLYMRLTPSHVGLRDSFSRHPTLTSRVSARPLPTEMPRAWVELAESTAIWFH
jgi:hypothetical protein